MGLIFSPMGINKRLGSDTWWKEGSVTTGAEVEMLEPHVKGYREPPGAGEGQKSAWSCQMTPWFWPSSAACGPVAPRTLINECCFQQTDVWYFFFFFLQWSWKSNMCTENYFLTFSLSEVV